MKRHLKKLSAYGLVMVAGCIGVLGFAILIALSLQEEYHSRIRHAQLETENITRVLEGHASITVQKADLILTEVSAHLSFADLRAKAGVRTARTLELNKLLVERLGLIPEAGVLQIANAQGDYIFSSIDPVPQVNISDRNFFIAQKVNPAAGLVISPPLFSRTLGGAWALTMTRRLNFEDGSFAGIVNMVMVLSHFEKFYASLNLGGHGAVLLRDADMRLLARHPPLEQNMGQAMPTHPVLQFVAKGAAQGSYIEISPADNIKRTYNFRRVGKYPLYVLAAIAEEDYLEDWWRHVVWYGVAASLIILVSLGLALFARRGLLQQHKAEVALEQYHANLEHLVDVRTQDLQEARKLADAASNAKSDFLANMSHEIRTPMNAIIGLTQLVLDSKLEESQRDFLSKVLLSSKALLGILNDILDYSKIEAGHLDLEEIEFSPEEVLHNVADLFSARIDEKGLELFIEIAPAVPDCLIGDPLRFGQIINNLVGNAIKFTSKGVIHIRAEVAESASEKTLLRVSVRDSGIGLAKTEAAKLFQPFTQADAGITRRFGGTGLGLSIARRLVELMQGNISVTSQLGIGSTFTFTARFGIASAPQEVQPRRKRLLHNLRTMHSLVVDDQETSLIILRNILENWNFEVSTARSGAEALHLLEEARQAGKPFDLLLLDWKMPDMDGLETAEAMRRTSSHLTAGNLPTIIMVTAYSREQLLKAVKGGAFINAILTKPVTPSGLFDTLLQLQNNETEALAAPEETFSYMRKALAQLKGARILLAEDNELNQQVACAFLAKGGLEVTVANNGREAVAWVQKEKFDAVLMDLHMPMMDGFEATRQIRLLPAGKELPIIAMTAAAMAQDRAACAAAGMNGHIAKPVDPVELAETLAKWIAPKQQAAIGVVATEVVAASKQASEADLVESPAQESAEQLIATLPGVGVEQALARMNDDIELYQRLLQMFARRHEGSAEKFRKIFAEGDMEQLYQAAHSLKGEAGNMGFDAIQAAADELGKHIKQGGGKDDALAAMTESLAHECEQAMGLLQRRGKALGA